MRYSTKRRMRGLVRSERGAAAIEFALIFPLILFMFIGLVELTRFVLVHQKTDKTASQLADFISQQSSPKGVTAGELRASFDTLMSPFDTSTSGFVISVVERPEGEEQHFITYQSSSRVSSRVGGEGEAVNAGVLRTINPIPRDKIVIVEVEHLHSNVFGSLFDELAGEVASSSGSGLEGSPLYKAAFYNYRLDVEGDVSVVRQSIGDRPTICGHYRDDEYDRDNPQTVNLFAQDRFKNEEDFLDFQSDFPGEQPRYYDLWPIGADDPHPCTCYAKHGFDESKIKRYLIEPFKKAVSTCRPQLLVAPYSCLRKENCCVDVSEEEKNEKGCYDNNDEFQEPSSPE